MTCMFRISGNGSFDRFRFGSGELKSLGAARFIASVRAVVPRVNAGCESREAAEKVFAESAADASEDGAANCVIFDMSVT